MSNISYILYNIDCGDTYHIDHGMVDFTGKQTTVNHSVPVHCNDGYELQGHDNITCHANGMWSRFTRCKGISKYFCIIAPLKQDYNFKIR